jgi:membrane-associated PAP2 superfamily phosphatase
MGFYFFAAALICQRFRWRYLSYLCYAFAIALGIALSFARMAQGGHYLSDVLFTALIMWLTALFFDWLIFRKGTA